MIKKLSIENIDCFIFDFDGVLTDNLVLIHQDGSESVKCSRADGLAFDVLNKLEIPTYILSTEKNEVVSARAKKLNVSVVYGVENKADVLQDLVLKKGYNFSNILYLGNDINDYNSMLMCGISACPSDSHEKIKVISKFILKNKGGMGVVRELLEDLFELDFMKILYGVR
jgi:YrbI family 3-deoxy-D-manno-octulosonate 8-phosphate phosphatase